MTAIFSAFTTTTKSPVSTCGVYCGLPLPRSVSAICVASRPRVCPSASTTYQSRVDLARLCVLGLHQAHFTERGGTQRPPAADGSKIQSARQAPRKRPRRTASGADADGCCRRPRRERERRAGEAREQVGEADQPAALGREGASVTSSVVAATYEKFQPSPSPKSETDIPGIPSSQTSASVETRHQQRARRPRPARGRCGRSGRRRRARARTCRRCER